MKTTFFDLFLHIAPILGINLYSYCKYNMTTEGITRNMNKKIKYENRIHPLPTLSSIKKGSFRVNYHNFTMTKINYNGSCYGAYRRIYGSCMNINNYFKTWVSNLLNAKI